MGIIACKFGGTSTAGADMFKRIAGILQEDPDRRYAVLSAPGRCGDMEKLTDALYRAWRDKDASPAAKRFEAIARGLGIDMDFRKEIDRALHISEAETVSRGEYLCAKLFARFSGMPFVDAADVIRFDGSGRLDDEATVRALGRMAQVYPRAVIPGFYGSGPDGRIVTFPRNGSDITGALVAAGVGAALYENWTDVPGLMTGDPGVTPSARVIPEVSYARMRALAEDGVRVLHPDCLEPVARAGIPTRIRCTLMPDAPGTLVEG
ncbi:MAG: hypothetical protein IJH86_05480 [Clostridia bacterium]|nr:hypothetical protein [Clostridia bacterium]